MLTLIACVAFPLIGNAIITADNTMAETNPFGSTGLNWDYVYNYKNSSSVAVDPYWVLTAAHVADDAPSGNLTIGATTYVQQEIIFHDTADLALVRYDKALPGHYSLYTGTFPTYSGHGPDSRLDAMLVGYGRVGTVYSTYYTETASGNGVKRWGTQKIDGSASADYDAGGTTGMTYNDGMAMLFDLGDSTYEAGVGIYDSGGGTFVNDGGTWKLAGINTVRYGTAPNYTGTFSVSASAYEPWITQTIPEPSTAIMLAGIAALFGVIHRVRCMFG